MAEEKDLKAAGSDAPGPKKPAGAKGRKRKKGRYQYGPFRVFVDSYCKGEAYLNLIDRKHQRMYLVVTIYEWGRWPKFTRKGGSMTFIIEMPKAAVVRSVKRLKKTGVRIRKLPTSKWKEKFFDVGDG